MMVRIPLLLPHSAPFSTLDMAEPRLFYIVGGIADISECMQIGLAGRTVECVWIGRQGKWWDVHGLAGRKEIGMRVDWQTGKTLKCVWIGS